MIKKDKPKPAFFEEGTPDPVAAATGGQASPAAPDDQIRQLKRKAGFYISQDLLDRFNTKFYELKLAGVAVENKSGLLEAVLKFSLDDLDKGEGSQLMARILGVPGA
jgi:hypothetical protein